MLREECPWDKEQTNPSLTKHTIEEANEVAEVAEKFAPEFFDKISTQEQSKLINDLKEELGDLLIQPLLHAIVANDNGWFNIDDVIDNVHSKLIRRHPHVFDKSLPQDKKSLEEQWKRIKQEEKE